jgi:hypothetical protein
MLDEEEGIMDKSFSAEVLVNGVPQLPMSSVPSTNAIRKFLFAHIRFSHGDLQLLCYNVLDR